MSYLWKNRSLIVSLFNGDVSTLAVLQRRYRLNEEPG
jgi:hypothetical protein